MSTFIFLEVIDDELVGLINGIREEVMGVKPTSSVHLTVRGPYKESMIIDNSEIDKWNKYLEGDELLLNGVGRFSADDIWFVYLKVSHKNLRKIWWKPDFPIEKYGFNPHITLLETRDRDFAVTVERFLKAEKLSFLCRHFRLTTYRAKQNDFFNLPNLDYSPPLDLFNKGRISLTFFQRLHRLIIDYKKKHDPAIR